MKMILSILILSIYTFPIYGQDSSETEGTAYSLFKGKTFLRNPLDLRDPFKRRINKKKTQQEKVHESGVYSNQADRIENKPIESIRIVGVMIGKERRAMAKIATGNSLGSEVFFIKEGMKIGPNGAEVKAILAGGVVLVEKIRNVYDQDEYLETVIPVSSE